VFKLERNQLQTLHPCTFQFFLKKIKSNQNNSNISNNQIATGKLSNLKEFHLAENKLITLPDEMRNLSGLSKITLIQNQFTALPSCIIGFTSNFSFSFSFSFTFFF